MTEANDGFGIPDAAVAPTETEDQRIARIRAQAVAVATQESDAELLAKFVAEEKAKQREALLPMDTSGFPAEYDKIEIYEGQDANALSYVPVGVNGLTIKIPRGEEVIIPHVFTLALENAVVSTVTQGAGGLIIRDKHSYPYQLRGKATPVEYKTYIAGQRQKQAMQEAAQTVR